MEHEHRHVVISSGQSAAPSSRNYAKRGVT
jgi:hypothetical protein